MTRTLAKFLHALAGLLFTQGLPATASPESMPLSPTEHLGQRIYREGILPDGSMLTAYVQNDVAVSGRKVACINCHRRSGFGSSEGGRLIPPITPSALFNERAPQPRKLSRLNHTSTPIRSAYTDATLAQAIQKGTNSDGKQLDTLMPRFALSNEDTDLLIAYLKRLSTKPDPGVTQGQIHIATIVAGKVEAKRRKAMLDVFEQFIMDKNANTRNESGRARRAPWHKEWQYEAYRKWKLHVWTLDGPPQGWIEQLEAHYKRQAVFAIVGGTGDSSWRTIHEFCASKRVPCVFPSTDLPFTHNSDFYSIYYSKGIKLEAETLAKHLHSLNSGTDPLNVLQIIEPTSRSKEAAETLSSKLSDRTRFNLTSIYLNNTTEPLPRLIEKHTPHALVFWTTDNYLKTLNKSDHLKNPVESIFLSSTLLNNGQALPAVFLPTPSFLLQPFDFSDKNTSTQRIRYWMRSREIDVVDMRLQADTFTAITLAADAMMHIKSNFSRDYFIEKLEHMIDDTITTSIYPRLTLAPGQRFASKGCYVVDLNQKDRHDQAWTVP